MYSHPENRIFIAGLGRLHSARREVARSGRHNGGVRQFLCAGSLIQLQRADDFADVAVPAFLEVVGDAVANLQQAPRVGEQGGSDG